MVRTDYQHNMGYDEWDTKVHILYVCIWLNMFKLYIYIYIHDGAQPTYSDVMLSVSTKAIFKNVKMDGLKPQSTASGRLDLHVGFIPSMV